MHELLEHLVALRVQHLLLDLAVRELQVQRELLGVRLPLQRGGDGVQ